MLTHPRTVLIRATILLLTIIGCFAFYVFVLRNPDPFVTKAPPELPDPPLKELSERRGIQIGSFASLKYLRERAYTDILSSEFEYLIIDGEPNWKFENHSLRPTKETFDFTEIDKVFNFADENDMPVRVQHLVWGDEKWLPDWVTQADMTNEELLSVVQKHIEGVTKKYAGRVREYSVVNEAFSRRLKTGGNIDWWGERLGERYIDEAFRTARQNDPKAILILNDFGNETIGEISNGMFDYVQRAKSEGVPIDAIGMQMHISGVNPPSRADVVENMRRFAGIGLKVYVTEFDVNMHDTKGTDEEKEQAQAKIYRDMLGACLDVGPAICPNFGFLGLVDRQSWYNGIGIIDAMPLMFRDDYSPKPSFFAVRDELENK